VVSESIRPSGYFFLKPLGRTLKRLATVNRARAVAVCREAIEVNRRYLNGLADIRSSLEVKPPSEVFKQIPGCDLSGARTYNVQILFVC